MLDRLLDWLVQLPAVPTYVVLMALSAVENIFPPVPADVAVALGAFLARRGEISVVPLGLLCWAANTGSAAWTYYFARRHGAAFFEAGWGRRLMPPEVMTVLKEAYAKYGVVGIFVSRFLPGLRAGVMPFAGAVGMPAGRALLPAALASFIWYAFLVAAGFTLADNWTAVKALLGSANRALGIAATVALIVFAIWLRRRLRSGDRGSE